MNNSKRSLKYLLGLLIFAIGQAGAGNGQSTAGFHEETTVEDLAPKVLSAASEYEGSEDGDADDSSDADSQEASEVAASDDDEVAGRVAELAEEVQVSEDQEANDVQEASSRLAGIDPSTQEGQEQLSEEGIEAIEGENPLNEEQREEAGRLAKVKAKAKDATEWAADKAGKFWSWATAPIATAYTAYGEKSETFKAFTQSNPKLAKGVWTAIGLTKTAGVTYLVYTAVDKATGKYWVVKEEAKKNKGWKLYLRKAIRTGLPVVAGTAVAYDHFIGKHYVGNRVERWTIEFLIKHPYWSGGIALAGTSVVLYVYRDAVAGMAIKAFSNVNEFRNNHKKALIIGTVSTASVGTAAGAVVAAHKGYLGQNVQSWTKSANAAVASWAHSLASRMPAFTWRNGLISTGVAAALGLTGYGTKAFFFGNASKTDKKAPVKKKKEETPKKKTVSPKKDLTQVSDEDLAVEFKKRQQAGRLEAVRPGAKAQRETELSELKAEQERREAEVKAQREAKAKAAKAEKEATAKRKAEEAKAQREAEVTNILEAVKASGTVSANDVAKLKESKLDTTSLDISAKSGPKKVANKRAAGVLLSQVK